MNDTIKFVITEHIETVSESKDGEYTLELNKVAWNDKQPKYDLRRWRNTDNGKIAQRGLTIQDWELEALKNVLNSLE
ncbi:MAG: hypothetical protein MJ172_04570 [Clostridia bacterium]|nr:hypothetical protein [Clostridia bacterium]